MCHAKQVGCAKSGAVVGSKSLSYFTYISLFSFIELLFFVEQFFHTHQETPTLCIFSFKMALTVSTVDDL